MSKPMQDFEKAMLFLYALTHRPKDAEQQMKWLANIAFDGDLLRAERALQAAAVKGFVEKGHNQSRQ